MYTLVNVYTTHQLNFGSMWSGMYEMMFYILGYLLHYKQASETDWHTVELSPESTTFTMDMLKCGSTYNAKVQARNKISIGPPSEVLTVNTRGGRKYLFVNEIVLCETD